MSSKKFLCLIAVLCFLTQSASYGYDYWWSGLAEPDNPSWADPNNWWEEWVPGPADNVYIATGIPAEPPPDPNVLICIVEPTTDANCTYLQVGYPNHGQLEVQGTLTVYGDVRIAAWTGWTSAKLTVNGGLVNITGSLDATQVDIASGELNIEGTYGMGAGVGGQGTYSDKHYANLNGGVITAGNFTMQETDYNVGNLQMDITGGELRIDGNVISTISTYVSNGWLTAYGGNPSYEIYPRLDTDPLQTIVTARETSDLKATIVAPGSGDTILWESFAFSGGGPTLEWNAGSGATSHKVYFGNTFVAVDEADELSDEYKGEQALAQTFYTVPFGEVDLGGEYYWRIDEVVGGSPVHGDVWVFSINDYRIVDEFDLYNSTPEMLAYLGDTLWEDGSDNGTGSSISLETGTVQYGYAMKLSYNNSPSPYLSEADKICFLTDPNLIRTSGDWVAADVKLLTMSLRGNNTFEEKLYVTVESNGGTQSGTVYYDVPAELRQASHEWFRWWYIELAEFSTQGVDLEHVTKMTIGIGDKDSPTAGGSGDIFVDTIRLYPSMCINQNGDADVDNDCDVDLDDVAVVAYDWLESDYSVTASAPATGPVLWYKFNKEGTDFQAIDSSGNGYTGNLSRSSWGLGNGFDGSNCLDLGNDTFVEVPLAVVDANTFGAESTIAFWLKDPNTGQDNDSTLFQYSPQPGRLQVWVGSTGTMQYTCGYDTATGWDDSVYFGTYYMYSNPAHPSNEWVHYAFVKSVGARYMRIYQNGVMVVEWDNAPGDAMTAPVPGEDFFSIGAWRWSGGAGGFYDGLMDDFRIYDYALSHEEVLNLAVAGGTATSPLTQGLITPSDVVQDDSVDWLDFAEIGAQWLQDPLLYP